MMSRYSLRFDSAPRASLDRSLLIPVLDALGPHGDMEAFEMGQVACPATLGQFVDYLGTQGIVGPQGPIGPTGATGAAGPQGVAGATGATGATGAAGPVGATGAIGAQGPKGDTGAQGVQGATGATGAQGPAGVNAFGSPNALTVSLATAYQATTPAKPAVVTINVASTANFSIAGGTTNTADVLIGATNAVASGTGTVVGKYANSVTGTIAAGLNMNSQSTVQYILHLPAGWFFAVRQTGGTVSIVSAFDQAVG